MTQVQDGVMRITIALPLGIDHVHCYAVESSDRSWTLVDAGVAVADPAALWEPILRSIPGPVERIVATHAHVDHMGGVGDVAELTGAAVFADAGEARRASEFADGREGEVALVRHLRRHGVPPPDVEAMRMELRHLRTLMRPPPSAEPLESGGSFDGWEVIALPGHADGHVGLLRGGLLIAGDAILDPITPTVGVYEGASPDPLGVQLATLEVIARRARAALTGHGVMVEHPEARAAAIAGHHADRAERARAAIGEARSAYEVSNILFRRCLAPTQRRLAVVETLAHLEFLARAGRAARRDAGDLVEFVAT